MRGSAPIFGQFAAEVDPLIETIVADLATKGLLPEDFASRLDRVMPSVLSEASGCLLEALKARAQEMLADTRQLREGFQQRQRDKWGKPLDLLLMLTEASSEAGEDYNASFSATRTSEPDFVFDALRRLHARGCLIASEILWLLEGGYASGAMARWRTLHEIVVVAYFIKDMGQDTAERYLLHHAVESFRSANQYQQHHQKLGRSSIPAATVRQLEAECDALCARFGKVFKAEWGWAAEALKPKTPQKHKIRKGRKTRKQPQGPRFADIENEVSLSHYRPYYKLACHSNHAGSKGIWFDLGNALNAPGSRTMLAGPSDAGLAEPGIQTAISMLQLTTNLVLYRNEKLTALIVSECLSKLTDEVREAFDTAEENLKQMATKLRRGAK